MRLLTVVHPQDNRSLVQRHSSTPWLPVQKSEPSKRLAMCLCGQTLFTALPSGCSVLICIGSYFSLLQACCTLPCPCHHHPVQTFWWSLPFPCTWDPMLTLWREWWCLQRVFVGGIWRSSCSPLPLEWATGVPARPFSLYQRLGYNQRFSAWRLPVLVDNS